MYLIMSNLKFNKIQLIAHKFEDCSVLPESMLLMITVDFLAMKKFSIRQQPTYDVENLIIGGIHA